MKKLSLFLFVLVLAFPCRGEELPSGKWSGSYCFAEDDPLQVSYQVEKLVSAQQPAVISWKISMNAAGVVIDFKQITLTDGQLGFQMNPGEEVDCLLELGDGGVYKGECRSVSDPDAAQVIKIFMRPPVGAENVDPAAVESAAPLPETAEPETVPDGNNDQSQAEQEKTAGQPT